MSRCKSPPRLVPTPTGLLDEEVRISSLWLVGNVALAPGSHFVPMGFVSYSSVPMSSLMKS